MTGFEPASLCGMLWDCLYFPSCIGWIYSPPTPCPNTVSSPFYFSVLPFHHSLVPPTRALMNVLWNSVPWFGNNEPETPIGTSEGVIGPQQFAHLRVIRCCSPQFPHPTTPTSRFKALRQLQKHTSKTTKCIQNYNNG